MLSVSEISMKDIEMIKPKHGETVCPQCRNVNSIYHLLAVESEACAKVVEQWGGSDENIRRFPGRVNSLAGMLRHRGKQLMAMSEDKEIENNS